MVVTSLVISTINFEAITLIYHSHFVGPWALGARYLADIKITQNLAENLNFLEFVDMQMAAEDEGDFSCRSVP